MTEKKTNPGEAGASDTSPVRTQGDPLALPPLTPGMRRFSTLLFFLIGAGLTAFLLLNPFSIPFLPAPGGLARTEAAVPAADEQETLYQCPMHADVIETEPGTCPICGMTLMPMEPSGAAVEEPAPKSAGTGEREILYWYAPMDPTFISDEPGISPMGMKMVPKYADEGASEDNVIRIDPVQVQNMGVISEPVHRTDLGRVIRTVGIMDFDADNVFWVNVKFSGWIEKVYVNYVGQEIRKGQTLFEIYSPELVTTQEEYLRALDYRDSLSHSLRPATLKQAEDLLASARRRLSYWDITPEQVSRLESDRKAQRTLRVTSPVDGVVVEVMDTALEGMFVREGMNLYKLADMSSIWVHVDVYESDLPWVREGQVADVELSYFPGETFQGKILYMYPELDKNTRTVKICVEIPNPRRRLRAGMYANVRIKGDPIRDVVVIPDSAILRSGERNVVFLDLGEGRYRSQEVELGIRGEGEQVEVRRGLRGDERVVVQAQFMLDSESRVQEVIRKMRSRRSETPAPGEGREMDEESEAPAPGEGHEMGGESATPGNLNRGEK